MGISPLSQQADATDSKFSFVGAFAEYDVSLIGGAFAQPEDLIGTIRFDVSSVSGSQVTFGFSEEYFFASGPNTGQKFFGPVTHGPWTRDENIASHHNCTLDPTGLASPALWIHKDTKIGDQINCQGNIHEVVRDEVITVLGKQTDTWVTLQAHKPCGVPPTFCITPKGTQVAFSDTTFWYDKDTRITVKWQELGFNSNNEETVRYEFVIKNTNIPIAQATQKVFPIQDNFIISASFDTERDRNRTPDPFIESFAFGHTPCQENHYFLKFNVSGFPSFQGTGTLKLKAFHSADDAFFYRPNEVEIRAIQASNAWDHTTITHNTQPPERVEKTPVIVPNPVVIAGPVFEVAIPLTGITTESGIFTIKLSDTIVGNCSGHITFFTVDSSDVDKKPFFEFSPNLIGPWSSTTSLPRPLGGHGSVATSKTVYVIGGNAFDRPGGIHCSPCSATNEVNFTLINSDGSLSAWQGTTPLPDFRALFTPVIVDNRIYVIGGHRLDGIAAGSNTAFFAEINTDGTLGSWLSTTSLPVPKFHYAAAVHNNIIYLMGGSDDGFVNTNTVRFARVNPDGSLGAWSSTTPLPQALSALTGSAAAFNGKMYIFGGGAQTGPTKNVYSATINADGTLGSWNLVSELPRNLMSTKVILKDNNVFLVAGHTDSAFVSNVIRSTINPDGSLSGWVEDNSLDINGVEQPRTEHYAALSGNRIYVTGGSSPNPGRTSTVFFASIVGPFPSLDLEILTVKPVQVVFDVDINDDNRFDFIEGKPAAVIATLSLEGTLSQSQVIKVDLSVDFDVKDVKELTVSELISKNGIIEMFFTPEGIGGVLDHTIRIRVDPDDVLAESNEDNNEQILDVTFKQTRDLHFTYIPVVRPITFFGYGPLDMSEYSTTVSNSGIFIETVYPASEFTNEERSEQYLGDPIPALGALDDALSLWIWGELLTLTRADRIVGIVPNGYFGYHLLDESTAGIYFGYGAPLSKVNLFTTPAHELGHTFNLDDEYVLNPDGSCCASSGNPATGYWVGGMRTIDQSIGLMGTAPLSCSDAEFTDQNAVRPFCGRWITDENFQDLFTQYVVGLDPQPALLVSGIVHQDGSIELMPLYALEDGIIDTPPFGSNIISMIDEEGNILATVNFDVSFTMVIDPLGVIPTDVAGFAFVVPYPQETLTTTIQIGSTTIEINPSSRLLHDAVDSIPDNGFINNPDKRRNALHNKIDALENMLKAQNINGAINKLQNDIRPTLDRWLVDYDKETPQQLSKKEILDLIDDAIERLVRML